LIYIFTTDGRINSILIAILVASSFDVADLAEDAALLSVFVPEALLAAETDVNLFVLEPSSLSLITSLLFSEIEFTKFEIRSEINSSALYKY
jgi:hypothetical protein